MSARAQLLDQIARFLARHRMSERRFGLEAVGSHHLIPRIRSGAGVTLTLIERAEKFMSDKNLRLGEIYPNMTGPGMPVQCPESREREDAA